MRLEFWSLSCRVFPHNPKTFLGEGRMRSRWVRGHPASLPPNFECSFPRTSPPFSADASPRPRRDWWAELPFTHPSTQAGNICTGLPLVHNTQNNPCVPAGRVYRGGKQAGSSGSATGCSRNKVAWRSVRATRARTQSAWKEPRVSYPFTRQMLLTRRGEYVYGLVARTRSQPRPRAGRFQWFTLTRSRCRSFAGAGGGGFPLWMGRYVSAPLAQRTLLLLPRRALGELVMPSPQHIFSLCGPCQPCPAAISTPGMM